MRERKMKMKMMMIDDDDDDDDDVVAVAVAVAVADVVVAVAVDWCCCCWCLFVCCLLFVDSPMSQVTGGFLGPLLGTINPSTFMELCVFFFLGEVAWTKTIETSSRSNLPTFLWCLEGMKHTPNPTVASYTFHFHHSWSSSNSPTKNRAFSFLTTDHLL